MTPTTNSGAQWPLTMPAITSKAAGATALKRGAHWINMSVASTLEIRGLARLWLCVGRASSPLRRMSKRAALKASLGILSIHYNSLFGQN